MRVFSSLAVAAVIGIQSAMAEPVMPPIRVRFNSAVLEDLFHSGDQRMFGAYTDLLMQPILEADKEAERVKAEVEELMVIVGATVSTVMEIGLAAVLLLPAASVKVLAPMLIVAEVVVLGDGVKVAV